MKWPRAKLRGGFLPSFILQTSSFFLATCLLGAQGARADEYTQTSHYSMGLFPGETLVVETRIGDVTVEGWNEPRVEVEAEKLVRAGSPKKARKLYDQIRVSLTSADREARLRAEFPPRRPWRLFRGATKLSVNFKIRMPAQSNLLLECVDGDIRVRGVRGDVEARVNYGDVEVVVPSLWNVRSLDARAFLGYAQSSLHFEGSAGFGRRLRFLNDQGEQDVKLRVRFGGIHVYSDGN
jgi:hypothetical protein